MRIALRFRLGARVIQLPSGNMPTISECACCEICRISVLRYASGIQSLGSIFTSASMRSWNARSSGAISSRVRSFLAPVSTICAYIDCLPRRAGTGGAIAKTIHFFHGYGNFCITFGGASRRPTPRSTRCTLDSHRAQYCAAEGEVADRHRLGRCDCPARRQRMALWPYTAARAVRDQRTAHAHQRLSPRKGGVARGAPERAAQSLSLDARGLTPLRACVPPDLRASDRQLEWRVGCNRRTAEGDREAPPVQLAQGAGLGGLRCARLMAVRPPFRHGR